MGVYRKVSGAIWSTANAYRQLKMALDMRISLIKEFEKRTEVVNGLSDASKSIIYRMLVCAASPEDRKEALEYAERFDIDTSGIPVGNATQTRPHRSIASRIIRFVSRFIPRPRP